MDLQAFHANLKRNLRIISTENSVRSISSPQSTWRHLSLSRTDLRSLLSQIHASHVLVTRASLVLVFCELLQHKNNWMAHFLITFFHYCALILTLLFSSISMANISLWNRTWQETKLISRLNKWHLNKTAACAMTKMDFENEDSSKALNLEKLIFISLYWKMIIDQIQIQSPKIISWAY